MKAQIERLERLHRRMRQQFSPGEMTPELDELELIIERLREAPPDDGFLRVEASHTPRLDPNPQSARITFNGALVLGIQSVGYHIEHARARPVLTVRFDRFDADIKADARP